MPDLTATTYMKGGLKSQFDFVSFTVKFGSRDLFPQSKHAKHVIKGHEAYQNFSESLAESSTTHQFRCYVTPSFGRIPAFFSRGLVEITISFVVIAVSQSKSSLLIGLTIQLLSLGSL